MTNPVNWLRKIYRKVNSDIWKTPLDQLSTTKVYLIRQVRIAYLLFKGIKKDGIYIKASALTFFTILSVIPMAALAFGISKGFGLHDELRAEIITQFQNQEQVMNWILDFANNTLEQTSGGWLAGVGVALLFYTVGQLLTYVESIFNSFWKVDQTRVWYRQLTDYLAVIIMVPVLFIAASSATVLANTRLNEVLLRNEVLENLTPLITFLVRLIPFILMCAITIAAYLVMPNTRVRVRPAIVAGLLAGIALQLIQILYIQMQIGATKLGTLYGSFAAVPLMMIWVQMSWVVVLIGAQLTYYLQNITRHEFEFDVQTVSPKQKKRLSLLIMKTLVKDFIKGVKPRGSEDISMELSIPVRSVRESLLALRDATLVTEVYEEVNDTYLYQPATDINKMTLAFVMDKLDNSGSTHKNVINNTDYRKIDTALSKLEALIESSETNILLRDL
jgi:membrane protein